MWLSVLYTGKLCSCFWGFTFSTLWLLKPRIDTLKWADRHECQVLHSTISQGRYFGRFFLGHSTMTRSRKCKYSWVELRCLKPLARFPREYTFVMNVTFSMYTESVRRQLAACKEVEDVGMYTHLTWRTVDAAVSISDINVWCIADHAGHYINLCNAHAQSAF